MMRAMSSFTCPHFELPNDGCLRLNADCVPGRKGCVLRGKVNFLIPADERVRLKQEESPGNPPLRQSRQRYAPVSPTPK